MIKVKVIKKGFGREVEVKCPECGFIRYIVTSKKKGKVFCLICHSKLSWEEIEE